MTDTSHDCIECGGPLLNTESVKYCSSRCMRRYVAREWKKNNRDKTREYNRRYTVAKRAKKEKLQDTTTPINQPVQAPANPDNIRNCRNCTKELNQRQKMYCSIKCHQDFVSKYNAEKRAGELRFAVNWTPERRIMTKAMRDVALENKGHTCLRCRTSEDVEVHHIRPQNRDGNSDISNLMLLCRECHDLWHKVFPDDLFWNKNTGP